MVWERRMRSASWICFALLWIPVAVIIAAAATEQEEPPVLAIAALFCCVILFAFLQAGSLLVGRYEKEQIKRTGIPAKAIVQSIGETGTRVNGRPLLRIGLEVPPPYDTVFTTTVEYLVPYPDLPDLQPGKKVAVFYLETTREVALADL